MSDQQIAASSPPDWDDMWVRIKALALRVIRSGALSVVAFWLSWAQPYADYSEFQIALLVFLLGALNRFQWLAGVLVLWLLMLYLAPPEMVAWFKAMRG